MAEYSGVRLRVRAASRPLRLGGGRGRGQDGGEDRRGDPRHVHAAAADTRGPARAEAGNTALFLEPSAKFSQPQRRPLLGPFPDQKCLLALSHLKHYAKMVPLSMESRCKIGTQTQRLKGTGRTVWLA